MTVKDACYIADIRMRKLIKLVHSNELRERITECMSYPDKDVHLNSDDLHDIILSLSRNYALNRIKLEYEHMKEWEAQHPSRGNMIVEPGKCVLIKKEKQV